MSLMVSHYAHIAPPMVFTGVYHFQTLIYYYQILNCQRSQCPNGPQLVMVITSGISGRGLLWDCLLYIAIDVVVLTTMVGKVYIMICMQFLYGFRNPPFRCMVFPTVNCTGLANHSCWTALKSTTHPKNIVPLRSSLIRPMPPHSPRRWMTSPLLLSWFGPMANHMRGTNPTNIAILK